MINLLRIKFFTVSFAILFFTGCASTNNQEYSEQDSFESMNRAIFDFNEALDDNFLEPAARGYKWLVPDPIELVIGNIFSNLNDVVVTANSLLQLNFESALASGTRVLINSTFGMLGMVDIASDITAASDVNLNKRNEDFGQTLGFYGVGSGPYLVLPLLGPSTVRDTVGIGVDTFLIDPVTAIYLDGVDGGVFDPEVRVPVAAGRALDARADLLDAETALEEAALDKYEFIRDAYLQRRTSLVNNEDSSDSFDIPGRWNRIYKEFFDRF